MVQTADKPSLQTTPSQKAPPTAASITFRDGRSISILTLPRVTGSPVSGRMILASTSAAGAMPPSEP